MKPSLSDVMMFSVNNIKEPNGALSFIELPFSVRRTFWVSDVRVGDVRGKHAHRFCEQFLICMNGSVNVTCDDGENRQIFILDSPLKGLYIPPMIWAEQYYHSNTTLLGLASNHFDESDYIRDYECFKEAILKS